MCENCAREVQTRAYIVTKLSLEDIADVKPMMPCSIYEPSAWRRNS